MRIVFWQNMLALHQAAHIRALAARGHDVLIVADEAVSKDRQEMGWSAPDFGTAQVIINPSNTEVARLVQVTPQESIHIVGGYRGYRVGLMALQQCLSQSVRVGLMSESGDPRGWKGFARRVRWKAERSKFGHRVDFVLAMGQLGVRWFQSCGYAAEKVLPYGYFCDSPQSTEAITRQDSTAVELIYVGQCIPRKGLDILIRSLALLKEYNWRLTVLGSGTSSNDLEHLAAKLGILGKVKFLPYVPYQEVWKYVIKSDVLVLPSRFDGWGMVVNEALLLGVPVICSDQCGASDLLQDSWRGQVFSSEAIDDLANLLRQWIVSGKRTDEMTARILNWSRCIEGDAAAGYLLEVFNHLYQGHPRPLPPWYVTT